MVIAVLGHRSSHQVVVIFPSLPIVRHREKGPSASGSATQFAPPLDAFLAKSSNPPRVANATADSLLRGRRNGGKKLISQATGKLMLGLPQIAQKLAGQCHHSAEPTTVWD